MRSPLVTANSLFLTHLPHHRAPKLLWPLAAIASVVSHGLALGLVRTLTIQPPDLPAGEMAPLPIQLVTLPPPDQAPGQPTESIGAPTVSTPISPAADTAESPTSIAPQTAPTVSSRPPATLPEPNRPFIEPFVSTPPPPVASRPTASAPRPSLAPAPLAPPTVAPEPSRPVAPVVPAPEGARPPSVTAPPRVAAPPSVTPAPAAPPADASGSTSPVPEGSSGDGGQVVPVGLRPDPQGRDVPDNPPQLLGSNAIAIQPLASTCGFTNLAALLGGMGATTVQMQIRVEPSGEVSQVRLLQGTGNSAVDDLVGCVVKQRLRLQPASSAGVPQLTDAYILDARIQFF